MTCGRGEFTLLAVGVLISIDILSVLFPVFKLAACDKNFSDSAPGTNEEPPP